MNRYLKFGLLGAGGVLGVALAGAAYIAATFDPNDYKDQIVAAVKQSRQRTLHLDGDIRLTFFPSLGADLGRISLSEYQSERPFASVDKVRVKLALMPLLRHRAVVEEVMVSGLDAALVRHRDGTTNIDDLLGSHQKSDSQPVDFDIASVSVARTRLSYSDEGSGARYAVRDLSLETGRIANGVPGRVTLSFGVQASEPGLNAAARLKTMLSFDLEKRQYRLSDMDFALEGAALDFTSLKLAAAGGVALDLSAAKYSAEKFRLDAAATRGNSRFEAKLDVPRLELASDKFTGGDVALDLAAMLPDQTFKARLVSPLSGSLSARRFELPRLVLGLNASGDRLPGRQVASELKGSAEFDIARQRVKASLSGGLLQSQIRASFGVAGFEHPALDFDVDLDRLDVDPYLPPKASGPEQPFDLSALRGLDLDGRLRIGQLKAMNLRLSRLELNAHAKNGRLDLNPLSASLYQGSMKGSLGVDATGTPAFSAIQNFSGVSVADLTRDVAGFDALEGRGNVSMNLAMRGNAVSAMKKSLGGTLVLNLGDGAIKGINVAKKLRDAQAMLGKTQTQGANQAEKTDFSELKASFRIAGGVAHNEDLTMKSPLLRVGGAGDIDIGGSRIDYLAKATLAGTLEGQGGRDKVSGVTVPVRISGPFSDLKYTLDFGAMVTEAAKQQVEAKKQEIKSKVQDSLKDSLKGLFR